MSENKSFFNTLPGVLTGLAAMFTALGGLIFALSDTGIISASKTNQAAAENNTQKVTQVDPAKHPLEQTTDGWAIIGKVKGGKYSELSLMVHNDSPAIGRFYDAVEDFRLVQKRLTSTQERQQTTTLGMVHRGDSVEVLDIFIPVPSTESVFVWAKLRTVLNKQ
ncbi:MAG: hypothetical protein ACI88A_000420 [Paraglaciecola sp.]|jgi:hypothetical protein